MDPAGHVQLQSGAVGDCVGATEGSPLGATVGSTVGVGVGPAVEILVPGARGRVVGRGGRDGLLFVGALVVGGADGDTDGCDVVGEVLGNADGALVVRAIDGVAVGWDVKGVTVPSRYTLYLTADPSPFGDRPGFQLNLTKPQKEFRQQHRGGLISRVWPTTPPCY